MDAPSLLSSIIEGASSRAAAYAVRDGGVLLPNTVSDERDFAICNYLALKSFYLSPGTEQMAEAVMGQIFPEAEIVAVTIEVVL